MAKAKKNTIQPKKKTRRRKRATIFQRIRESWFYRIYFGLLLLCAVGLVIGLVTLSDVLAEYEQTRPIHTAEEMLARIQQRNWNDIYQIDLSARSLKQETPEQYAQYMQDLTAGKEFTLKSVLTLQENEQQYNVMLDGQKFAEIILEHSGVTTSHNYNKWQLKSLETHALASTQYTITVPSDSTVQINGIALTQADIVESGIATEASGNLPDGEQAPTMTKYSVNMSFGAPGEFIVTDKNGKQQQVTQDDERSWSTTLAWDDDAIKAQCEEEAVKWGRRLAAYTTGDYNKFTLSESCINPSPARTYIRNMENQWAANHSGVDFENIQTYDYYVYSDNCFSCKISFDYIVHYTKNSTDKTYPTKYTMYFQKQGGTFKLYSFTMH